MEKQTIFFAQHGYEQMDSYLKKSHIRCLLLVCGKSILLLNIHKYFEALQRKLGIKVVYFSAFQPNPTYESIVDGVDVFHEHGCDAIFAVGGGSAMDVAKCIKLYANMQPHTNYLKQKITPNNIKLFACPTTAGTGSEATSYAVIYYKGEKQSVSDYSCIPTMVLLDASTLLTLPLYQKKVTMLDALCHAVESFWSINSTDESKEYSRNAISLILKNKQAYLNNEEYGNAEMLKAANIAGKAINITQTTAGHAMCYKLTSLYGIPHGYAAALCVAQIWPYMLEHPDKCNDPRGMEYLRVIFQELANTMGCSSKLEAVKTFQKFIDELNLESPHISIEQDYELLNQSVNPVRLKNHPIKLDKTTINILYHQIL